MIGQLCAECHHKKKCQDFGISPHLISRLMIGKSVHDTDQPFPINIYKHDIESENLSIDKTLRFLDEISPYCIYLK